jgi:cold shock protein
MLSGPALTTQRGAQCPRWGFSLITQHTTHTKIGFHNMTTATVKFFNDARGFGFLAPDDKSADLFFHHSNVVGDRPVEGDRVSFEPATDLRNKKPHAVNVRVLN